MTNETTKTPPPTQFTAALSPACGRGRLLRPTAVLAVLASLLVAGILPAAAQVLGTAQLGVERRGHTTTTLTDGRVLVAGGENAAGPIAQAELVDPVAGAVTPGPAGVARVDHAAVRLGNGRVLISGGRGASGPLASAELYDPTSDTFAPAASMTGARVGHSATRLDDGRVLIAGGDAEGSAEIFDPATAAFTRLDYKMIAPRAFHGTAVLEDGKVLIAGGSLPNGTVLQTGELFEPSTGSFARISRRMSAARFAPTLTPLPDGKVQIIGGDDASTMEVFSGGSRLFNALVHLPPSAGLLSDTLRSRSRAALFTVDAGDNPGIAGASPDVIELLAREDHAIAEAPGRAVVTGGSDKNGNVSAAVAIIASSGATVSTDATDYSPGELVTISGAGWQPGETVTLLIREEPETHADVTVTATADGTGRFTNRDFRPDIADAGRNFTITAVGLASNRVAQTVFSDAVGIDLEQCQNGSLANLGVPCGTASPPAHPGWETGNINDSNSAYREGDGVPYRLMLANLTSGTWTIRLQYMFTKGGIFGFDRLTRYDLTQASDPCLDNSVITCTGSSPAFDFEMPGEVVTPSATEPALANGGALVVAGSATPLTAADRRMTVWVEGATTATFISAGQNDTGSQATSFNDNRVEQSGLSTGDSDREFAFKISLTGCPAAGCVVMLGWTTHLASAIDWGAGKGASSISGSPYHMTLVGVDNGDGTTGGSRDRSMNSNAFVAGGTIVIEKVTDPATDTTTEFSFTATGPLTPTSFKLKNGEKTTYVNVAPGKYTVTEAALAGWALTDLTCVDPSGGTTTVPATGTANIDVAAGETVTCTYTNTKRGQIIVKKVTIPNTDTTTQFGFTATGGLTPASFTLKNGEQQTIADVVPNVPAGATYAVSESTIPAGWALLSATCDDGSALSDIKVSAGETVTCTFTNTQAASIVIKKLTDPASDTTTSFGFTASGLSPTSFNLKNTQTQTFTGVTPNQPSGPTYSVGESTIPAGWSLAGATCDNGSAVTDIKVSAGQTVTCTFNNTGRGTIIIKKLTDPAGDTTTVFGFTGTNLSPGSFTLKNGDQQTFSNLTPGNGYAVAETTIPATWSLTSATCDDGSPVTAIDVSAGETVTCTFRNTQTLPGPTQLIVIKHVINNNGGTKVAGDFTMTVTGTAVIGGTTSFPGQEAPGTTTIVNPGTYSVTESAVAGYVASFSGDCTNVTISSGQTKTCTVTNRDVRPAPPTFCSKSTVTALLSPSGRFKNNKGLDNLVRVDLGESIQDAVDSATDANGDGYILIGVVAGPGSPAPYGGNTNQRVVIDRAYPKPFALVGCSVTMHATGAPVGWITSSASSPTSAANPASILVSDLHAADSSVVGWRVDGNQRELRNVNASASAIGLLITGSSNNIVNGVIQGNNGVGILVSGNTNVLDTLDSMGNQSHGIQISGHNNQVKKLDTGDIGKSNGGDGANVSGSGNVLSETSAFANAGHGILVSGPTNQLLKPYSGDKSKGNGGDGIRVTGAGNLIQEGRTSANRGDGLNVAGGTSAAPNRVKAHQSNTGAAGSATENGLSEYRLLNYVTNFGGNNRADNIVVPKTTAPVKCPTFPATNATVNITSTLTCE